MGRGHKKSDHDKCVERWKRYYDGIGSEYCPVLSSKVIFDDRGWWHFFDEDHSKSEIERRLEVLPLARKIIRERKTNPGGIYLGEGMYSHTFIETHDNKKIKTLVYHKGHEYWYVSLYIITPDPFRLIYQPK